jgi:methylthioribose-1-phosphate isomerase
MNDVDRLRNLRRIAELRHDMSCRAATAAARSAALLMAAAEQAKRQFEDSSKSTSYTIHKARTDILGHAVSPGSIEGVRVKMQEAKEALDRCRQEAERAVAEAAEAVEERRRLVRQMMALGRRLEAVGELEARARRATNDWSERIEADDYIDAMAGRVKS